MVSIGTLSWKVQVENAEEAKQKAKEVSEKVKDTKEAMTEADDQTESWKDRFDGLNDVTDTAKERFGALSTEAGVAGTAFGAASEATEGLIQRLESIDSKKATRLAEGVNQTRESFSAVREEAANVQSTFQGLNQQQQHLRELYSGVKEDTNAVTASFTTAGTATENLTQRLNAIESEKVNRVADVTQSVSDSFTKAASTSHRFTEKLRGLRDAEQDVSEATDRMNAKTGFLGTALSFTIGTITSLIGALTGLSTLLLAGGIIAAIGALAYAWMENLGGIRTATKQFITDIENALGGLSFSDVTQAFEGVWATVEPLIDALADGLTRIGSSLWGTVENVGSGLQSMNQKFGTLDAIKSSFNELAGVVGGHVKNIVNNLLQIGDAFVSGFTNSGVSLQNFHTILTSVVDGVVKGLKTFWSFTEPIMNAFADIVAVVARVVGRVFGELIQWAAKLEQEFGILTTIVKWVTVFVAAWSAVQGVITLIGGLISVIGTIAGYLAPVISTMSTLGSIFLTVGQYAVALVSLLEPISTIILALIVIGAALYAAWKTNFLGIRDVTADVIGAIEGAIDGAVNFIMGIFGPFLKKLDRLVTRHFTAIKEEIGETVAHWQNVFSDAWGVITGIFQGALNIITGVAEWAWGYIEPIWTALTTTIISLTRMVANFLMSIWNTIASTIVTIVSGLWNVVTTIFSTAFTTIMGIVDIAWQAIQATILTVVDAIGTTIRVFLNVLQGDWSEAWNAIKGFLNRTWNRIKGVVKDALAALESAINGAKKTLKGAAKNVFNAVKGVFTGLVDDAFNIGKNLIKEIANGISNAKKQVTKTVKNVVSDVRSYLPFSPAEVGPLATLDEVGPGFIDTIVNGIENNSGAIKQAVKNVAGKAAQYLPFSPAEKGPLKHIDKSGQGLVKTVAKGIEQEQQRLTNATQNAMSGVQQGLTASEVADQGVTRQAQQTALSGVQQGLTSDGVAEQGVKRQVQQTVSPETVATDAMTRRGRAQAGSGGSGDTPTKIDITIDGVEIGDQTLDIQSMGRHDLQKLAEEIATTLGDEVRSTIS